MNCYMIMKQQVLRPPYQIRNFKTVVEELELMEIPMEQARFTWWNKRQDQCSIHVVLMVSSDHHALVLVSSQGYMTTKTPSYGVVVVELSGVFRFNCRILAPPLNSFAS